MKKEIDFSKIPYFETKVVKVKKEKKDFWCGGMNIDGKQYKVFKRGKGVPYLKEFEKANIINGENIDKMEFPCWCSFSYISKDRVVGLIHYIPLGEGKGIGYQLIDMSRQRTYYTNIPIYESLEKLIKAYDIHVRKAKLLIFKEEK